MSALKELAIKLQDLVENFVKQVNVRPEDTGELSIDITEIGDSVEELEILINNLD